MGSDGLVSVLMYRVKVRILCLEYNHRGSVVAISEEG